MTGSSSGSCSGSRYLDPHRVFELFIRRKPRQLLDYLGSIPGTSRDLHYLQVGLYARTLRTILSRPPRARLPLHEEDRMILWWAHLARIHATNSRFCAPRMVGNPPNFPSDAGHYMHPHNSSSYSGRMLSYEPDSIGIELIQSAASASRTPTATLLPVPEIFDDVHRHSAMHNQSSASSSRIHASMLPPLLANTKVNFPTRRAGIDETSASYSRTHASDSGYVLLRHNFVPVQEFAELSLGRPGSEQFTPQMLMRDTEDIKGKGPAASEADQAKILRLNVASRTAPVGPRSTAGLLIRDGRTSQFMTASCFRQILYMDPDLLFASACCEGIRLAVSLYAPTIIVLQSHQVHLLERLVATQSQASEVVQLDQLLGSNPPYFIIQSIPEECNRAASQLAVEALIMEASKMVYKDPPAWLVPYLDQ